MALPRSHRYLSKNVSGEGGGGGGGGGEKREKFKFGLLNCSWAL